MAGPMLAGATLSAVLKQAFDDDITTNIMRACVLPQVLPIKMGTQQNIQWVHRFTDGGGYTNGPVADGATVSVYNSDTKAAAVLQYTTYMEAVAVGGRAQSQALAAGNPAALADLLGEEVIEASQRLALIIAQHFYTGTGASNQLQGLYSTTGTTYGGLMGTGTYAGINRATYSEWAANVLSNGGVARDLTIDLMRDMRRTIFTASGLKPDLIVTDPIQFEKYGQLLGPARRYTQDVRLRGQQISLDGGFTSLDFDGIPVLEDANHPAGKMSFLNTQFCRIMQLPFAPASMGAGEVMLAGTPEEQLGGGNIKLSAKIVPLAKTGDVTPLELVTYPQIVVRRPNACGHIADLRS